MTSRTRRRVATATVGVVLVVLTLIGVAVTAWPASPEKFIATVDGVGISRSEFDQYAAVFRAPDGTLTITHQDVLLSLINQRIVSSEATRLGITVSDQELDEAVAHWEELGISRASLAESGGLAGLRDRFRRFAEMAKVKAHHAGAVTVSDHEVRAEFAADLQRAGVTFAEAAPTLRERLVEAEVERLWIAWLTEERRCASVKMVDTSLGVPSSSPGPGCGTNSTP